MKYLTNPILNILLLLIFFFNCGDRKKADNTVQDTVTKYATGFKISHKGKCKLVEVTYPYQNAKEGYTYLLVPKGEAIPEHDSRTRIISIPLENIVCTSTTHIPLLDYLGLTDKLIGFPTTNYISSVPTRKRIDEGKVIDLGIEKGMNIEKLINLKPSAVMGYSMGGDEGQLKKVNELGIPVIINAEYLEKHPLGRAEWIKFMALFFNKEKAADSVFSIIENEYLSAQEKAKHIVTQPYVMSGIVYGDIWFMPGGQNYAARILKDAGCNYLWANDSTKGYLEVSFETVFSKAREADLWIGVASFQSLKEISDADRRYASFKPFRAKEVYTYNARKGAKGGSEFLELGYLRCDLILKDLIKIAHPELLPDHSLYFYQKLPD